MKLEEIRIIVQVEAMSTRAWKADAIANGGARGLGTGTSRRVAIARAVGNLINAIDDESENTPNDEPNNFKATHWINAGIREGEKCMFVQTLAENGSGEPTRILVQYQDGTQGEERMRFLKVCKRP